MRIPRTAALVALAFTVSLSACSTTLIDPASNSTPGPTADATEPSIDTIVFEAEGVSAMIGERESIRAEATDTYATVAAITKALGTPDITDFPASECTAVYTRYSWGDALIIDDREADFIGDFSARVFSAEYENPQTGQLVALRGPAGEQVGDDISAFTASIDPTLVEGFEDAAIVMLERGWDDRPYPAGVAAFTEGGVIRNLGMPIAVNSGADC